MAAGSGFLANGADSSAPSWTAATLLDPGARQRAFRPTCSSIAPAPPPRAATGGLCSFVLPDLFIALDDGHTEPESPETHISAVGAVRPPKRRLCVGVTQAEDARFVAIRGFDWLYAGEAIARGHLLSVRSSPEHSRGREGVSAAACRSR
ncbi:hypothetical protein G5714_020634 [Onychostoma macrolepis]|uniref:Uncharacterized protein n=1 Tax=Onychostoma macrolepis TaxID=369639 RepID=A0A7J6BUT8_9TELE|nr:hypothetical protein G5714_020634 [Onychostoma macrolepis]